MAHSRFLPWSARRGLTKKKKKKKEKKLSTLRAERHHPIEGENKQLSLNWQQFSFDLCYVLFDSLKLAFHFTHITVARLNARVGALTFDSRRGIVRGVFVTAAASVQHPLCDRGRGRVRRTQK